MPEPTAYQCTSCARTTDDKPAPLELMPSGKTFKRHSVFADSTERCTGGTPKHAQTPEGTPEGKAHCIECGLIHTKLKSGTRVAKHMNPETLLACEQRENASVGCPINVPGYKHTVTLREGKMSFHKFKDSDTRCPGSNRTLTEARKVKTIPEIKAKAPDKVPNKTPIYKSLPGIEKSMLKAKALAKDLAAVEHPWKATYEQDVEAGKVELLLTRGKGADQEVMSISWWNGACFGGEGKITHAYKGRIVAVRNASAIKQRGRVAPEQIKAEFGKVATRVSKPRTIKTVEQKREMLPFDPSKADDTEVLLAVLGKTVKWENTISGKEEADVVKSNPVLKVVKGERQLTFRGTKTTKTIRLAKLISVG